MSNFRLIGVGGRAAMLSHALLFPSFLFTFSFPRLSTKAGKDHLEMLHSKAALNLSFAPTAVFANFAIFDPAKNLRRFCEDFATILLLIDDGEYTCPVLKLKWQNDSNTSSPMSLHK